jgi:two-component system OmpR family sensor kinase
MKSMRSQLLQWLMAGIAFSSLASGISVYRYTREEIDELYNANLQQLAVMLAQQLNDVDDNALHSSIVPTVNEMIEWEEEVYLIQLWDKKGRLYDMISPRDSKLAATIPLQPHAGLFSRKLENQSWRIYRADGEHITVQIAQPKSARKNVAHEISQHVLLPLILQIPVLIFFTWVAVRKGLRPLDQLSRAIAQRHPTALDPLQAVLLPIDLQPLAYTLNALLERLRTALQQQRNLIADAAHELRTPLAALQLQLDLLRRAEKDSDRELTMIQLGQGIQRATYLVGQLLLTARIEATPSASPLSEVQLEQSSGEAIERHLPAARARNIDLGVTHLEAIAIRCAKADIDTVLDNLLSNAIRYTPDGGRVDLAVYRELDQAVIDVLDTGIGIPEPERERIFDRFHRVLTVHAMNNATEGSGLGLAIVKSLCERYGATILVDAGPNNIGTRFRVNWPLPKT